MSEAAAASFSLKQVAQTGFAAIELGVRYISLPLKKKLSVFLQRRFCLCSSDLYRTRERRLSTFCSGSGRFPLCMGSRSA
jgi:hypothetical protein